MDDFELEIKREFLQEALMNLEEVEGSFMELESSPDPKPLLDKIFRLAHNLKGGSRAVGFGEVAEFTHQLESLVLRIQKDEVALSSEIITLLLRSNDRLIEMLAALKADMAATCDNSDILVDLQKWLNAEAGAPAADKHAPPTAPPADVEEEAVVASSPLEAPNAGAFVSLEDQSVPSSDAFFPSEPAPAPAAANPAPVAPAVSAEAPKAAAAAPKKSADAKEDEIIRVSLSRIDLLNDFVGELIVLQSGVQQQAMEGKMMQLRATIRQVMKLSKDIQTLSMGLRMLPAKPLIQKLQRVVRDTAQALGKEVQLEVEGDQLEIDKSVLDRLADPLIHILRNAVDHGLETTEGRLAAGKPSAGLVRLVFANEGNHLVIEVRDDGKGIDSEILRKKAIEKKLITETQSMTERQLINLIFHPGFSTKAQTSEISGRGVGMDVVKTNVEKIGGQIDITTVVGGGSVFRLMIPLSLAVIEGLVVMSKERRYVVPLNQVQETINLKSHVVHQGTLGIGSSLELRGTVVPLLEIEDALHSRKEREKPDGTALIIMVNEQPMGLVVADIVRAQQIVIKPLSNGISAQKGWVGSCVLGDGSPTLIISPVDLLSGRVVQSIPVREEAGVA